MIRAACTALVATLVACGSHDSAPPERSAVERQTRKIEPPTDKVRALPPHAIRSDGVGPYKLGMPLSELVQQLPSGPRITTLDVPNVIHRSILRGEDDAILIGGEPLGRASFVAVVGGEVARTENGLHVGSTREELIQKLGPPLVEPDRALDPRVVAPTSLPGARVVLDGDRVAAIVVLADPVREHAGEGCTRPASEGPKKFGICLSPNGEIVTQDGEDLTIRLADSDKPFGGPPVRVPGLVYAVPLRNSEGRDDLVAIARNDDGQTRSWIITAFRFEVGRGLKSTVEPKTVYQLTAANARWIGAELKDLDLYLELESRPDSIEVGGLLTTKGGDRLRDVVTISPTSAERHRVKAGSAEAQDAGVSDAH